MRSKTVGVGSLVVAATVLAACGGDDGSVAVTAVPASFRVNVVSSSDPVMRLVGEVYVQALENNGVRVGRKDPVADQDTVLDRLAAGEVQVAPGLSLDLARLAAARRGDEVPAAVLDATTSAAAVLAVGEIMPADVFLGDPTDVSGGSVIACSLAAADEFELADLADLAAAGGEVRVAGPEGFDTDDVFGINVLADHYGADPASFTPSADPVQAVVDGDADCAATGALDTSVVLEGLLPLADPDSLAPLDVLVPVFSADGRTPDVLLVLSQVNGRLTTEVLRALLVKVEQEEGDIAGVVGDYLASAGG